MVTGSPDATSRRAPGYRLLGRRFDYILHLRPAEWPIMAAHTALGSLLAYAAVGSFSATQWRAALLGLVFWVVLLNGGTLALNSAFDRDEGDIAYLRAPPPAPRHLALFGLVLMAAGIVLAELFLPAAYRLVFIACVLLSVLYSAPPFRLKAVAGLDWLINLIGFGALTPLAGWLAVGVPVTRWGWFLILGFAPLFAALYPLTQLYQMDEDRARGDRTLALLLGPRTSLAVATAAAVLAFVFFALAGRATRWAVSDWRWVAIGVACVAWMLVLLPWLATATRRSPASHQRGMYLALAAWAVTDVAVAVSWLR
jgi:4-hydroxybenzoate polyprenyltransferase